MGALPIVILFSAVAAVSFFIIALFFGGIANGTTFIIGYLASITDILIMLLALKPYLVYIYNKAKMVTVAEIPAGNTLFSNSSSLKEGEINRKENFISPASFNFSGLILFIKNLARWVFVALVLIVALTLVKHLGVENYIIYFVLGVVLPFFVFLALGIYLLATKKKIFK